MENQNKSQADERQDGRNLNIDIEHMSVTGHVAFAGRDASIQVNTGGDVAQNSENSITVGGIETTPAARDSLVNKIRTVEEQFETEEDDEETKEVARHHLETIKRLLLGHKKPNPKILINSIKSLAGLGPLFVKGISEVLGEPLAIQIVEQLAGTSGLLKAFTGRTG